MRRQDKIDILRSQLSKDGPGLELGPHVNPMFRKSNGCNVAYLEARTTEQLRELMLRQGRDPALVEDIDFILQRDKRLPELVRGRTFDWVASSHVIEHIPDLVRHLQDVSAVLEDGGHYVLIVPDKNYCFDCLKPASSLGSVIEAYLLRRQTGSIESMVNEWRYAVRPQGVNVGGWNRRQAALPLDPKYENWISLVKGAVRNGSRGADNWYGHYWRFAPPIFADIMADLIDLDLIDLEVAYLLPTHDMDFLARMTKMAKPDAARARRIAHNVARDYRPPSYPRVPEP